MTEASMSVVTDASVGGFGQSLRWEWQLLGLVEGTRRLPAPTWPRNSSGAAGRGVHHLAAHRELLLTRPLFRQIVTRVRPVRDPTSAATLSRQTVALHRPRERKEFKVFGFKRVGLDQEFTASDEGGRSYRLRVYRTVLAAGTFENPDAEVPGLVRMQTHDGRAVIKVGTRKYEIIGHPNIPLTSTDPNAL